MFPFEHRIARCGFLMVRKTKTSKKRQKSPNGNQALISKEQHWRAPAKKLEEEKTTILQGWQEKPRGTEKLKRILISQVNG